jgi:acetyl esterase
VEYVDVAGADHGYDGKDDERALRTYSLIARQVREAVGTA